MDECLRWAADVMFKHVNKNMAAFLCQEWEDFVLYNSKVLICGDREGLGRDTQGFLRGAFARISLIAGVSQLSWGKLFFMTRHFSCLHLLVQSPLIWAAKEWPNSAEGMHQGIQRRKQFGLLMSGIGTIWLQFTWLWEADSGPAADSTFLGPLWKVTSCSRGGCA